MYAPCQRLPPRVGDDELDYNSAVKRNKKEQEGTQEYGRF